MKKITAIILIISAVFMLMTVPVSAQEINFAEGFPWKEGLSGGITVDNGVCTVKNVTSTECSPFVDILPALKNAIGNENEIIVRISFTFKVVLKEGRTGETVSVHPAIRGTNGSNITDPQQWNKAYRGSLSCVGYSVFTNTDGKIKCPLSDGFDVNHNQWIRYNCTMNVTSEQIYSSFITEWNFCLDEIRDYSIIDEISFKDVAVYGTARGWVQENGNWVYYENGVKLTNTWKEDSHGWCYLLADGTMATNKWIEDSQGWCYVGENGYCLSDCWMQDSVGWCYLNSEGRMATNEWILDSVGWCYVGSDGYCVTNRWMADSVGWVYLDSEGRMKTNAWVMDSVGWCYVGSDGYAMTNCWMADSIGWCYLDAEGRMVTNDYVEDSNGKCWLDSNGYWDGKYHSETVSDEKNVWIPTRGGQRYHSSSTCSNMIEPVCVSVSYAISQGFTSCGRCNP